ncbi:ATP-binding protein, partial [Nocardiopsis lucentensis]
MSAMPLLVETSATFVGRETQLRFLREHARRAHEEAPGVVLIGGDAGVGKSRLVSEFVAAHPEGTVLVGGCLQLGVDGLAYAPFTAVLRQFLRERGRAVFEAAAPGGVGEFARLLPELGEVPAERRENRGILFEQILRLLTQAARDGGLTVVLEDLHWSDSATRDLLVFLIRNLDQAGIQFVVTYRSDDLHRTHPLRRLLPELERVPGVHRIRLEPLSRDEVGRQAAAIRGVELAPDELDDLYRRTDGFPLFVESLACADDRAPGDRFGVPDRFRDLLLEPLHRLDDTALSVLRVASVGAVSGDIEHEMLHHAAELPERELETALHTLVDANLLRVHGTGYRFRHALLRDAVHGELLPGPHARLHLRFAQLIDAYPESAPADRRAAEQAHHFMAAQELPRALQASWWAAVRAGDALAADEELAMLERVLSLWARVPDAQERVQGHTWAEVMSLAAGAALAADRHARARELTDEALAVLPRDDDDHTRMIRAELLRRRGQARAHDPEGGGVLDLARALELHPPHMPGYGLLLSILARESLLYRVDRDPGPDQRQLSDLADAGLSAEELARSALRLAERSGVGLDTCAAADARITLGGILMSQGDPERGRPLIEEGIRQAADNADPNMEARGAGNLGHFLRELGRHQEGLEVLEESLARHAALGWASVHSTFNNQNRAEIHFELGDLVRAREIVGATRNGHLATKNRWYIQPVEARTAAAMGDLAAAREAAGPEDRNRVLTAQRMNVVQLSALAQLETDLVGGAVDEALELSVRVLEKVALAAGPGYSWPLVEVMAEAAQLGLGPGWPPGTAERARRVRALAGEVVAEMPVIGPVQGAYASSCTARFAMIDGTGPGEALAAWRAAVTAWEGTQMRLYLARAWVHAAEAAVQAGERAWAVERVREAHAVAVECAARPLARA